MIHQITTQLSSAGVSQTSAEPGELSSVRQRLAAIADRIKPELILPPEPPVFTGNRAVRRTRDALDQLRSSKTFSRLMRATAWVTTFAMLHMIFAGTPGADLWAQPSFQDFEERSKSDADRYVDRAKRLND
ncbi:MAG: hypothetical protein RIF32_15565, partial [Leptospirales bacterium]